jgi:hypothetical protein
MVEGVGDRVGGGEWRVGVEELELVLGYSIQSETTRMGNRDREWEGKVLGDVFDGELPWEGYNV